MSDRKFWIRKDREQYLLSGVIITCVIAGFVSSYWHFSDRIHVRKNIHIKARAPKEALKRLKEVPLAAPESRAGDTRFYRLDAETKPVVPKLEKDEANRAESGER